MFKTIIDQIIRYITDSALAKFFILITSPAISAYTAHLTDVIKVFAPFSYYIAISIGLIIALILIRLLNDHNQNEFLKQTSIENKLIVLENAIKIDILSTNGKDYCVVKVPIFNCSNQIINVSTNKPSTWIMINEKSQNPLDHYYFPELFLPYDYNNAIQTPPIEVDLSNKTGSIQIALSIGLNYSIHNSDTNKSYKLNFQYKTTYDILPKSSFSEKGSDE